MQIKAISGNVLIKMDTKQKERYALTKDVVIQIERGYDFNLRQDRPSMAIVIDGENLPTGSQVLVNYLSLEPTYEVCEDDMLTDEERQFGYKVFSIPKDMCFCYFNNDTWIPCENYLLTLRIFKPYKGKLQGIEPEIVKNRMYIVSGTDEYDRVVSDLSGKVAITTVNCDYQIIWHNKENRVENLIRTMSRELMAVDEGMTKQVKKGELLIGFTPSDCKILNHEKEPV